MLMGAAILVGAALSIMLGVRVYAELAYLQRAPHDNIQWTVAQLETEILRLRIAAGEALGGDDARLEELRKRFDIFYSRVALVRSGSVFAPLREDAAVSDALNALHAFLIETAPLIDYPDEALRAGVPDLIAQSDAHHATVRRLALAGVEMFARNSDAFRREFASLVRLTAFAALVVFVLLFPLFIAYQLWCHHAPGSSLTRWLPCAELCNRGQEEEGKGAEGELESSRAVVDSGDAARALPCRLGRPPLLPAPRPRAHLCFRLLWQPFLPALRPRQVDVPILALTKSAGSTLVYICRPHAPRQPRSTS